MDIKELVKKGRVFIIPLDHPPGEDSEQLEKIGVQNFVDSINLMNHDGYIFHANYYVRKPIKTSKDFFLTVGEQPENFKLPLEEIKKLKKVKNLTIFFEVDNPQDRNAVNFYKDYVSQLKNEGYVVMGMGYPSAKFENPDYQIISNIAKEIGCDYFKTDLYEGIEHLDLKGMNLFIAGGEFLADNDFKEFVGRVVNLDIASLSFGRNIFESDKPLERINFVLNQLK